MEPIVIFTRVRLCDKPVLKEAKNKTQFYVFTIQTEGSKYACKLFEDSECFEKIGSLHLEGGDYLDLQCTMKKMIQKIKMPATSEDGDPCEVVVPHDVTHFKLKYLDFANKLINTVPFYLLRCNMELSAAQTAHDGIFGDE